MWLDDDLDPDSEESRAQMMQALEDAVADHDVQASATPTRPPTSMAAAAAPEPACGHCYHQGPPRLQCSVPWGLMLLREANPTHGALQAGDFNALDNERRLSVHVDWQDLCREQLSGPVTLRVRRGGAVVAQADGRALLPLKVGFDIASASAGDIYLAELTWAGGSRHLHMHAPLHAPVRLGGLLSAPSRQLPTSASLLASERHSEKWPLAYLPDRALGLELELLTVAPDPQSTGVFTKGDELKMRLDQLAERAGADETRLHELLSRCAQWEHEVDDHVMVSSESIAHRAADEALAAHGGSGAALPVDGSCANPAVEVNDADSSRGGATDDTEAARALLVRLHAGGAGIMKSEFKSPSPAAEGGALNLARGGGAELACFMRVVASLGAGAAALSSTANGGTSLHVHVNVRHESAGGDVLACEEILDVLFSWVAFDLIVGKFPRPWIWREPSMAPLYATGSEFAWRETAWAQGTTTTPSIATQYDIPALISNVRALYADDQFAALSDGERLERLFGRAANTPAAAIGRYCGLNLRRLTEYGTLEFRRFNGTLDDGLVVRWAHFCAAFVECFRGSGRFARLRAAASDKDACAVLAHEQEHATPAELMRAMSGFVDPHTAESFMRDSGALPPSAAPSVESAAPVLG